MRLQKSYYAVLKVTKQSEAGEIRANHLRLSRVVHPDKCSLPQAAEASSIVNQAADTLRNSIKKALYDSYVEDVTEEADVSYAEWEANAQRIEIPRWVERILRIPGGGICLLIVLLPFTLLLILLLFVLWLLCLPVRCVLVYCCGVKPPADEAEPAPAPAQQAAAPAEEAAPAAAKAPISEPLIPTQPAEERV